MAAKKHKFEVGQFVCDKGDQSMGVEITFIHGNGKLVCAYPKARGGFESCELDPKDVELWTDQEAKAKFTSMVNSFIAEDWFEKVEGKGYVSTNQDGLQVGAKVIEEFHTAFPVDTIISVQVVHKDKGIFLRSVTKNPYCTLVYEDLQPLMKLEVVDISEMP